MTQTKSRPRSRNRRRRPNQKKDNKRLVKADVAGGVVFAKVDGQTRFLIIQHALNHQWSLPKGHVEKGETTLVAAKREILEETGIESEVLEFLDFTHIQTTHDDYHLLRKFHAYLLEVVGSTQLDPAKFDPEENMISDVVWATPEESMKKITYRNIRPLLRQAGQRLKELNRA